MIVTVHKYLCKEHTGLHGIQTFVKDAEFFGCLHLSLRNYIAPYENAILATPLLCLTIDTLFRMTFVFD